MRAVVSIVTGVPIQSLHVLQARERLGDHGVAVDDVGEVHEGVLLLERLLGAEPHGEVLGRVRVQLVPDEGRKKEEGRRKKEEWNGRR